MSGHALVVGVGPGLGASLARTFSEAGYSLSLVSRQPDRLSELCDEIDAKAYACDASDEKSVADLFTRLEDDGRIPELVVYNAGSGSRGPVAELDLDKAKTTLSVSAWGALVVAHEASKRMLSQGEGTLLFTGASAGIKGFARSAPFAMAKFALRGLCQSLARELAPKNIHVAHFVIDGLIHQPSRGAPYDDPEKTLLPDEIANAYLDVSRQHRSAWTYEMELRPYVETF
ncbi:MAG: SDR family NAD(P)-dependent oxidoreductase [Pseudomonadota bacterium]